jgi:hypothetical protein
MSEEPRNRRVTDAELEAVLREGDLKNQQWKKDHPPLPKELAEAHSAAAKKHAEKTRDESEKFNKARRLYADLYYKYKDRKIWNQGIDARINEVLRLLKLEGEEFTAVDTQELRTALEARTVSMQFGDPDEDGDLVMADVPIYPAS